MKVLITGGLGYIGSHLAIELSMQGRSVDIVDRQPVESLNPNHLNNLTKHNCQIFNYHLETHEFYQAFAEHDYDAIYHFGEDKVIHLIEDDVGYLNRITQSAYNVIRLVKECIKPCKLIYSSSGAVYGGVSKYKQGKKGVEKLLTEQVCNLTILRFGNPLGCYHDLSYSYFTGNALAERLLQMHHDLNPFPLMVDNQGNSTVRAYVAIYELIEVCIKVMTDKSVMVDVGTYNLATRDLVEQFIKANQLTNVIQNAPLRPGETHTTVFNTNECNGHWQHIVNFIQ